MVAYTPRIPVSTPRPSPNTIQSPPSPRVVNTPKLPAIDDRVYGFQSVLQNLENVHNTEIEKLHRTIQDLSNLVTSMRVSTVPSSPMITAGTPRPVYHPEPVWEDLFMRPATDAKEKNNRVRDSLDQSFWQDSSYHSYQVQSEGMLSEVVQSDNVRASLSVNRASVFSTKSSDDNDDFEENRTNTLDEDEMRKKTAITTKPSDREARRRVRHLLEQDTLSDIGLHDYPIRRMLWFIANSVQFEVVCSVMVLVNSVFLGLSFEISLKNPDERDPMYLRVCEYFFTVMFTIELVIRVWADGFQVYCDPRKMHWFFLDTFVVATSLFEAIYEQWASSDNAGGVNVANARTFRIVRIVRIVRGVRIARLVRFVRSLRTLVLSITHTLKSVVWSFVLLFLIIYVFGLVFAQVVHDHIVSSGDDEPLLELYWGTLFRSMLTLYKTISNGLSWHECIMPLSDASSFLVALFLIYVSFTVFAVLNVITGIFCEAAIESSRKDNEMMIQQHLSEKEKFTKAVCNLFGVKSGEDVSLSYSEFEDVLTHPNTSAYLAAIQLDISDAWELFKLLDTDESALIDVEEFVHGCLRLKGTAKAIDVAKLDYETKIRQKRLQKHMVAVEKKLTKIIRYLSTSFTSMATSPEPEE